MLREFPPPRLAKLAPSVAQRTLRLNAECKGELTLRSRTNSANVSVSDAHGTFELTGNQVEGTLSVPLPPQLSMGPASSDPLAWRVVEVRPQSENPGFGSAANLGKTSLSVLVEVEYNHVRTQTVHLLEFETGEPGSIPSKVHLFRLALDPNAHRLRLATELTNATDGRPPNGNPLKRVELALHCGLSESNRSQP